MNHLARAMMRQALPADVVPASTSIRRSRVKNIDTDRLIRRREWLRDLLTMRSFEIGQRSEFALKTGELAVIENELENRGALPDDRITMRRDRTEVWNETLDEKRRRLHGEAP